MNSIPGIVKSNRDSAYSGEIGVRRLKFCLDYTAYKKASLAEGEKLLWGEVEAGGERITCQKGCSTCCNLYVMASLQEAECVTYHLYQNETLLRHFLAGYRRWRQNFGVFAQKMPRLEQLIARNLTGRLSGEEEKLFDSYVHEYAARRMPCPFLNNNSCSIYEIRPFSCASLVAVTPPEGCLPDAKGVNTAEYRKIEVRMDEEMPYFLKSRSPVLFGCFPELVNHLLVGGYSFLEGIEWLEPSVFKR